MTHNFFEIIADTLGKNPHEVLLMRMERDGQLRQFSGHQLMSRINGFRSALTHKKVRHGAAVLLGLSLEEGAMEAALACMAEGVMPLIPPAGMDRKDLPGFIRAQKIGYILTAQPLSFLKRLLLKRLGCQPMAPVSADTSTVPGPIQTVDPALPALISFSSGSTGPAKRIERTHAVLTAQHLAIKELFPPWAGQFDFPLFPNVLLHNLAVGVPTLFPDIEGFDLAKLDPARVLAQLKAHAINSMTGNVHYFTQLLVHAEQNQLQFEKIKAVGVGGSPVPDALLRRLSVLFPNAELYTIYGSTEAEPIAIRRWKGDAFDATKGYRVGPIVSGLEWKIEPNGRLPMEQSEVIVGEVMVKGAHVIVGEDGWLHTGDHGYYENGELVLTARAGNSAIYWGVQHYMIEHRLSNEGEIEKIAAQYGKNGFKLFYIGSATKLQIEKWCEQYFPTGLVVSIERVLHLPLDQRHRSKILYHKLPNAN